MTFTPLYSLKTHSKSGTCFSSPTLPHPLPLIMTLYCFSDELPNLFHLTSPLTLLSCFSDLTGSSMGLTSPFTSESQEGLLPFFPWLHNSYRITSQSSVTPNFHGAPILWDKVRAFASLKPRDGVTVVTWCPRQDSGEKCGGGDADLAFV